MAVTSIKVGGPVVPIRSILGIGGYRRVSGGVELRRQVTHVAMDADKREVHLHLHHHSPYLVGPNERLAAACVSHPIHLCYFLSFLSARPGMTSALGRLDN